MSEAPGGSADDAAPSPRLPYEYALLRAMPRRDRGECLNVGVILYCQGGEYLDVAVHVDPGRLRALDPGADPAAIADAAEAIRRDARDGAPGTARDGGGLGAVFRWLTAPRSTVLHPGPVHAGMTADPAVELQRLLDRLVR
jgi:hypothetical protein